MPPSSPAAEPLAHAPDASTHPVTDPSTDPVQDRARLDAVRATALLDAPAAPALERLARLAARLLRAPIALVSLVDGHRQFFAASVGLAEPVCARRETPLSHSFCQHVVRSAGPLVTGDAREHPLLRDNLAIPDLGVVAYAGMPLVGPDGEVLGSFCAIDGEPRTWTAADLATLEELARAASSEIHLHAATRRLAAQAAALQTQATQLATRSVELANLLDATGEMVCAVGADGRITYVNRAWCETFGYTREEAAALRPAQMVAEEHRSRYVAEARRLLAGEPVDDFEAVLVARDGRRVVCRGQARPILEDTPEGPRCVGARALYRDVTPVEQEALRRRAARRDARADVGLRRHRGPGRHGRVPQRRRPPTAGTRAGRRSRRDDGGRPPSEGRRVRC